MELALTDLVEAARVREAEASNACHDWLIAHPTRRHAPREMASRLSAAEGELAATRRCLSAVSIALDGVCEGYHSILLKRAWDAVERMDACIQVSRAYQREGERCAEIDPDALSAWRVALVGALAAFERTTADSTLKARALASKGGAE